jgi:hypothetical protein
MKATQMELLTMIVGFHCCCVERLVEVRTNNWLLVERHLMALEDAVAQKSIPV